MLVSLDDFKADIDRYLELIGEQEITITKDGRQIAQIVPLSKDKRAILESLCGILPPTATLEEAREARIAKHERHL